jgi:hypothetical protein
MHLEELQRILACGEDSQHQFKREINLLNAGLIQADTLPVLGSSMADLDMAAFQRYCRQRFGQPCPETEQTTSLASLGLLKEQQLTLAGVLLFGLQPQRWLPVCMVNALMHRDYFDSASIRILVFRDRIEIISPGHLPGDLSTDDIQHGKTKRSNPILSEHAAHLLPYRGLGSGIHRAQQAWPQIERQDHRSGNEFRALVGRPKPQMRTIAPAGIGGYGLSPKVTDPVTDPVMRLLQILLDGALPPSEIQRILGIKHRPTFRVNYLRPALAAGWAEMTVPDKPNSRLQRYQLTEKGRKRVQQQGHP